MQSSRTRTQVPNKSPRPPRYQSRQSIQRKRRQVAQSNNYEIDCNITQPTVHTIGQSRVIFDCCNVSQIQYNNESYSPNQNVADLLDDFQQAFKKLLQIVPIKYQVLLQVCKNKYLFLKQILTHYQKQNHLSPYYFELHSQSTDTKNHLLKLLNQQKNMNSKLKETNQQIKSDIRKMAKSIKLKSDTCEEQAQKIKSLQQQIKQLEEDTHKKQLQLVRLRQKMVEKDEKLIELAQNKQKIMQDLNQIEQEMKTLNFISDSQNNIKSKKKIKSAKKIRIKIPSCHKIYEDQQKYNKKQSPQQNQNQDLYRFLAIQAMTIEEDLFQQ